MKLNLSHFKKVAEDAQTATLKHPAGHSIKIAKKILSKERMKELSALPLHFDEGGSVLDNSQAPQGQAPVVVNVNSGPQGGAADQSAGSWLNQLVGGSQQPVAAQAPAPAVQPQASAPQAAPVQAPQPPQQNPSAPPAQAQPDPYGTEAYTNAAMQGLNEQKAGIFGEAQAQGALGAQEAKAYQESQDQLKHAQDVYNQTHQEITDKRQALYQDLQNQHINPTEYIDNMSTGKKIRTAIGLIIGGLGGPNNMAAQMLQKNIENGIKSQEAELGKKKSLLGFNMQDMGDARNAFDMTRINTNDIISNHIKQMAAQNQGSMASAKALQLAGQLDSQSAALQSQLAIRHSLSQGQPQGPGQQAAAQPQVAPEQKIRMLGMSGIMPEPEKAKALEELKAAEGTIKAKNDLFSSFDFVSGNNTALNRIAHLGFTPAKTEAAIEPLLGSLTKETEGRVTPTDIATIRPLFPAPGDSKSTVDYKRMKLQQFIDQKMNFPTLDQYGIDWKKGGRYNEQGQKSIQLGPVVKP